MIGLIIFIVILSVVIFRSSIFVFRKIDFRILDLQNFVKVYRFPMVFFHHQIGLFRIFIVFSSIIIKPFFLKKQTAFPFVLASFLVDFCRFSITRYHIMSLSVNSLGLFTIHHQIIIITFPLKNPQNQDHTHHGKNPKISREKMV